MSALRWRWHRVRGGWRCAVGLHRLRGHVDLGDGESVEPYNPHASHPRRGAWRVCTWCGAQWDAAYDGITPFWWRREKLRSVDVESAPGDDLGYASDLDFLLALLKQQRAQTEQLRDVLRERERYYRERVTSVTAREVADDFAALAATTPTPPE